MKITEDAKLKKRLHRRLLTVMLIAAVAVSIGLLAACGAGEVIEEAPPLSTLPPATPEPTPEPYYWPLTGVQAGEAFPEDVPPFYFPLCIKIENTPDARPQLGLVRADVVYESLTEGDITRFNAIFQSDIPDYVGPVRSARNSDLSIVPEYDGILFFSGTNDDVWADLGVSGMKNLPHGARNSNDYYHRESTRPPDHVSGISAPHNLYLDSGLGYEWAVLNFSQPDIGFTFSYIDEQPNRLSFGEINAASPATEVISAYMPFSGGSFNPTWTWDPNQQQWLRTINSGTPFVDAGEGNPQITASNVVVLYADHVPGPSIPNKGNPLHINLAGTGSGIVFRDGVMIEVTWMTDGTTPPRFYDSANNEVPLAVGKTWFQVLKPDKTPTIETPQGMTEGAQEEEMSAEDEAAAAAAAEAWE